MASLWRATLVLVATCARWAAKGQDLFLAAKQGPADSPPLTFTVSYSPSLKGNITGRVRLRLTPSQGADKWELLFGKDVHSLSPGSEVTLAEGDSEVYGYPLSDLSALRQRGVTEFSVKAELMVYDLYKREGLPATWLPTSCVSKNGLNGEYSLPDGTLLSDTVPVTQQGMAAPVHLVLDKKLPDSTPASPGCAGLGDGVDSAWIKTVRLNSSRLGKFWGRRIQLEACVLLPFDFERRPDARYPLVVAHGHYSPQWEAGGGFRETAPACDERSNHDCFAQWNAYRLYRDWSDAGGRFKGARTIVMTVNHPVPFFDDSYAVNSASMGPYGDAIVYELIPEVERRFRGLGQGWARGLMGGSTGGWESFAVQVFYPDEFNYAHAACPDPLTFTSYVTADIYKSQSYFVYDDPFLQRDRPATRDHYSGTAFQDGVGPAYVDAYGVISQTMGEANHQEYAQGTHSRSCGQWDIWEAVFSPACEDGFPCRLYDKLTGELNHSVAEYWRENYDFARILERDWETLGPKLRGKLHVAVGASDTFYLTNAVLDLRNTLQKLGSDAEVVIGAHDGVGFQHCFNGYLYDEEGKALPNAVTRDRYLQTFVPKMALHFAATAPAGADTSSWRY